MLYPWVLLSRTLFLKHCKLFDFSNIESAQCTERSYIEHCLGENNNNPAKSFFLFGFQFQTINVVFHNSKEKEDMIQRKGFVRGFIENGRGKVFYV